MLKLPSRQFLVGETCHAYNVKFSEVFFDSGSVNLTDYMAYARRNIIAHIGTAFSNHAARFNHGAPRTVKRPVRRIERRDGSWFWTLSPKVNNLVYEMIAAREVGRRNCRYENS